jgi:hypothetical protein
VPWTGALCTAGVQVTTYYVRSFASASAVYATKGGSGFRRIPPFGPYRDDPLSLCYEKALT